MEHKYSSGGDTTCPQGHAPRGNCHVKISRQEYYPVGPPAPNDLVSTISMHQLHLPGVLADPMEQISSSLVASPTAASILGQKGDSIHNLHTVAPHYGELLALLVYLTWLLHWFPSSNPLLFRAFLG